MLWAFSGLAFIDAGFNEANCFDAFGSHEFVWMKSGLMRRLIELRSDDAHVVNQSFYTQLVCVRASALNVWRKRLSVAWFPSVSQMVIN